MPIEQPAPALAFQLLDLSADRWLRDSWLARRNITADWGRAAKDWKEAMNQFAILYEDHFTKTAA